MIEKELIEKIRHIEIHSARLVNTLLSGEYHSVFKGQGMEFAEVREYTPGDDVRGIDWNVTARLNSPFVKIFEEERELTVMLMVDMSGSLLFGSVDKTKQQIAAELTAILAFSAMKNNDKVGLILFTDRIEKFVPPRKGRSHGLRIIREILSFEPAGNKTDIRSALEYFNHTIKKKSIAFLISDFIDEGYEKIMNVVGKKHDLIGVVLNDPRESEMPRSGLIKFKDAETGNIRVIDTSNKAIQQWFSETLQSREVERKSTFIKSRLDAIEIKTSESYVKPLVNFFKMRERRV